MSIYDRDELEHFDKELIVMSITISGIMDRLYKNMLLEVNPYQSKFDAMAEIINSLDYLINSTEIDEEEREYFSLQKGHAESKRNYYRNLAVQYTPALVPAFEAFETQVLQNQNLLNFYQSMFSVERMETEGSTTKINSEKLYKKLRKKYPIGNMDLSKMIDEIDTDDYLTVD